jgi:hypothetical protein
MIQQTHNGAIKVEFVTVRSANVKQETLHKLIVAVFSVLSEPRLYSGKPNVA